MSARTEELSVSLEEARNGAGLLLVTWLFATMSLWFFAFYDLPAQAPEWIRRAQVACFGTDECGLPGAAGWMVLALSPAAFFGAILTSFHDEAKHTLDSLWASSLGRICLLALGFVVLAEVGWVTINIRERIQGAQTTAAFQGDDGLPDNYPYGVKAAPDFTLAGQNGGAVQLSTYRGRPVLLSFVFAHCQAVCPTLVKTLSTVLKNSPAGRVQVMLITLDPWRDTPATLPGLAKEWALGADAAILSGSPEEVNAVLDAYQVPRQRDGKSGDVVHPAIVHLIDPHGILAYSFNNPSAGWLEEALARVSR